MILENLGFEQKTDDQGHGSPLFIKSKKYF